jgi:hypothetical protein
MNTTEEFLKPKMTFGDTLKFTAYAYAKLLYIRDRGNTEVAGYCVTATEDPLLVTDFILIKQQCTSATFDLDPEDGVEYMERMMDAGLPPWAFSNILCHTHPPGCSPHPSDTDEINFKKAFSHPNWAIMLIIAENSAAYCRLKINIGPGIIRELQIAIDWSIPFEKSDMESWKIEYESKVTEKVTQVKEVIGAFPKSDDPLWRDKDDKKWVGFHHVQQSDTELEELECWWNGDGDAQYWDEEDDTWYTYDPVGQQWYIDEDNELVTKIETPKKPWAEQVVAWCVRFSKERDSIMNDHYAQEKVEAQDPVG